MQPLVSERRVDFSAEEIDVLDRVLSATARLGAGPRLEAVALLQSTARRALCRKVLGLRSASARASAPSAPVASAAAAEGGLRRDWPTGEWSAEVAERALTAWEQSGLSETAFCRTTGISRGRIRGWKRKLRP
ncbi:MAG: hypothetical protein IT378_07995, partial [Sandaracinaceae bacterium]|nr:hypothetical protein [Sandaracinaceae bacterium]